MTVTVLNANHPHYWIDVYRRAAIRKASKIVEEELWMLKGSCDLYELYLREINRILHTVAKNVGIKDDAGFAEMKAYCVKKHDLPDEILTSTEAKIEANATDAVKWAIYCEDHHGICCF